MNNEGFDDFLKRMDKDALDNLGQREAMQIAYQEGYKGGAAYVTERWTSSLGDSVPMMLRRQAE